MMEDKRPHTRTKARINKSGRESASTIRALAPQTTSPGTPRQVTNYTS